jgi:hypothetical protein
MQDVELARAEITEIVRESAKDGDAVSTAFGLYLLNSLNEYADVKRTCNASVHPKTNKSYSLVDDHLMEIVLENLRPKDGKEKKKSGDCLDFYSAILNLYKA